VTPPPSATTFAPPGSVRSRSSTTRTDTIRTVPAAARLLTVRVPAVLALAAGALSLVAAAAPPAAASDPRAKVVILALPDLRWIDLATMPALRAFSRQSAVAELSVKTAGGAPRCADGSTTFSAGNRVSAEHPVISCSMRSETLAALRVDARDSKYAAVVGAFGQAVHHAGLTTAAVGTGAVPLLADESGAVDHKGKDFAKALELADVVATLDDTIYYATGTARLVATQLADQNFAAELAAIPPSTTVVVAGTSDGAETRAHLHVLMIRGAGWRHVTLRSPSTRPPYVQLRDVAPTVLSVLHIPTPSTMIGGPAYETGTVADSYQSYADDDDHAVTARDVGKRLRESLCELGILVVALLILGARQPRARTVATWLARFGVGVPVCSYLAQLLPWWRWGPGAYGGIVVAGAAALAFVVARAARRSIATAMLVGPGFTAAALAADQLLGAPLQLSAPFGDNPIVAGRFHGMGNTAFALMCGGALIVAALVGERLRPRGRGLAVGFAAGLCLVAMVIDAAPSLGDDFGGLLAMAPVTAVLLARLAGVRLTFARVLLIVAGVALLAVGVALADYARPAADQTHVGQFVGQVLHGGAWRVVRRKLDASLGSFGNVAITGFVLLAAMAALVARRALLRGLRTVPGLLNAAVAVGLLAVLGTFLNDSGIVVASSALWLGVFTLAAPGRLTDRHPPLPAEDDGDLSSSGRSDP
jgi:hypothetical protein